ncbi:hypothetical protein KUL25_04240 [Rhodobacteraceae bacterium N5(2021)]|uniref:Uncharacterized protein n=1 Tax=Gymnodinialimonas phycosphaerae TaxID=2841589 RepID=A0A975TWY9_9RHOB|nr:hypothetical protein [Gymnodinialimonas phycosphaerae]MBY4891971.1 hypothetical protein [Gymnodinialimonas phycosphaerae]
MLEFAPHDAVTKLDALIASAKLPAREADQCCRLADTLRRPARVCLLGFATGDIARVAQGFIGAENLFCGGLLPAVELHFGQKLMSKVTLEDGTTLEAPGWPSDEILQRDPVFLQIFLPEDRLRLMSLLVLVLQDDPAMQRPALSWASRRSEITVWCTPAFNHADAQALNLAPERLTQHAYLLETRPNNAVPKHSEIAHFAEIFSLPHPEALDLTPLTNRLIADIEDARVADLDMAQLILHRLGHFAPKDREQAGDDTQVTPHAPAHDLRPTLSEPLLFLIARTGELAELLSPGLEPEDWVARVLSHCSETVEGLRHRAANWPEDVASAQTLKSTIEDIGDMIILLEIEGQAEQAQDTAALLFQLRVAFEKALGWETV